MQKYELAGHEPSLLPEGKNWKLVWHDEFDGAELDTTKWDYRTCMMGKEHPAWIEGGVHLDGNSNCVFTLMEHEGRMVSAQLQTGHNFMDQPVVHTKMGEDDLQWPIGKLHENKFTHKYGYYECRCRLQQKAGWWSAFWVQSPINGATLDPADSGSEIDIMECFHPGKIAPHNVFTGGCGLDLKGVHIGNPENAEISPDEFHVFGMMWDENGYTFYIDGKEDGHIDQYISHRPEFIMISTEVKGYRLDEHKPFAEAFDSKGDTFVVDFVRVYDAI